MHIFTLLLKSNFGMIELLTFHLVKRESHQKLNSINVILKGCIEDHISLLNIKAFHW